jgi:uncharacterized protein
MREIEIRELQAEERIVTGIAIPWGEVIDLGFTKESFTRGSVSASVSNPLFYQHKDPIGRIIDGVDTEEGLLVRAKISKTALGDDVIQLIKDGVITGMSIGFSPQENTVIDGVTHRTKAKIHEISLVGVPAYSQAKVLDYRSVEAVVEPQVSVEETENPRTEENTKMEEIQMENIEEALTEMREDILTLQRSAVVTESKPVIQYRSYGEYIKAYAAGDENARTMFRAYTGGTSADSVWQDGWVGDKVLIVNKPRKVLNVFGKASLPSEGMNVEYAKINANTTAVAVQAAEGDVLSTGKVSVTTATAPVKTFGGYTEMTRQEIERANVNILDKAFEAMAAKYATATNSAVRAALVAAALPTINIASLATATGKDWLGAVVDAATALDVYNYSLDSLVVSSDVFKAIATLTDGSDRPLLYASNPSNNIGSVAGLSASLAGVPVVVDPAAAAKTAWFASKQALTTYESAGAPFRLNDGDITNLSNTYSVYGYMAVAVHDVNGVIEAVIA